MTQAPIPLAFFCSGDGDFWKELSGLTGGPLHSFADCLQRVIMLDKAPSIIKAYIAAFKRWHRWATDLKLPTLPAKAPHVTLFLLHLAQETSSCAATAQSVAALRWMHEKAGVADPISHRAYRVELRAQANFSAQTFKPAHKARAGRRAALSVQSAAQHLDQRSASELSPYSGIRQKCDFF